MDRPSLVAAMRRFCDRVFEAARDQHTPGTPWYLDKSPDTVDRVPILAAIYPDAWHIHILRDGREVSRSLLETAFPDIDSVADAAANWVKSVGNVIRERWRLPRFRELRYEDLLADPLGETLQLFEWMGLPVTDEVVARVRRRTGRQVARLGSTGMPRLGRWREMDPADLAIIYEIAGDILAELGYLDRTE
jgi:hypothetical protein